MLDEKQRIQDTEAWPQWPKLPMKRRQRVGMPQLGYILATEIVDEGPIILRRTLDNAPDQRFENLDTLLAAGWVGD